MEDIGGVSLAVVVGKVPGVQVNFHKKDKRLYHLNREMTYHCTHILHFLSKIHFTVSFYG